MGVCIGLRCGVQERYNNTLYVCTAKAVLEEHCKEKIGLTNLTSRMARDSAMQSTTSSAHSACSMHHTMDSAIEFLNNNLVVCVRRRVIKKRGGEHVLHKLIFIKKRKRFKVVLKNYHFIYHIQTYIFLLPLMLPNCDRILSFVIKNIFMNYSS